MPRFSKAVLTEYIEKRVRAIQKAHHFKASHGWVQVIGSDGDAHRAYGEFNALLELAEEFELTIDDPG